jgi:hypothetical protein
MTGHDSIRATERIVANQDGEAERLRELDLALKELERVSQWISEGKFKYREDILEGGLNKAPAALIGILEGTNFGKLIVQMHKPDAILRHGVCDSFT